jgi:hypothetical protein
MQVWCQKSQLGATALVDQKYDDLAGFFEFET